MNDKSIFSLKIDGYWRFYCQYDGKHFNKCPCNDNGICKTKYKSYPYNLLHNFDGKNTIKCLCG